MRSLYREEDVEQTLDETESSSGEKRVQLDSGENAIWILSPKQENGFVHWVKLDEGRRPIVCAGGREGGGWAPDECMLCDYLRSQYAEAREASNSREAEGIKSHAKRMRANASVSMIVAKGEMVRTRIRNKKTGKFRDISVPVFDSDELEVGILKMSNAQYKSFIGLVKNSDYPYIRRLKDLGNRPIIFDKRKRGNDAMETVECRPGSKKPKEHEIEWSEDDFDLEAAYQIDMDRIEEVVAELTGDTDDDDEEDIDEEFLDDEEEDDEADDDDFEDDIPE